jgi:DNA replicative helicase MCM subunit Mcm2 (Cdc46/Mcm family)
MTNHYGDDVMMMSVACPRFDLLHVMIDEPDDTLDYRVAHHIVAVHQRQNLAFNVPYTMTQIQLYLKFARAHKPELTPEVGGTEPCVPL